MTLELKYSKSHTDFFYSVTKEPFLMKDVYLVEGETEHGAGHFAITDKYRRDVFFTDCFEYVRNIESGLYYIKDGKWVFEKEALNRTGGRYKMLSKYHFGEVTEMLK